MFIVEEVLIKIYSGGEAVLKRIVCTLLLVLVTFGISLSASAEERFQWLFSSDTITFKIDSLRLIVTGDENILYFDTWIRWDYNTQGVTNLIDLRKKNNLPTKGYENLAYSLKHEMYSAGKDGRVMSKALYYADYAFDGSLLDSFSFYGSRFEDVIPNSVGEQLAFETFNFALKNNIKATPK